MINSATRALPPPPPPPPPPRRRLLPRSKTAALPRKGARSPHTLVWSSRPLHRHRQRVASFATVAGGLACRSRRRQGRGRGNNYRSSKGRRSYSSSTTTILERGTSRAVRISSRGSGRAISVHSESRGWVSSSALLAQAPLRGGRPGRRRQLFFSG